MIELVVVLVIIALLAGIAVTRMGRVIDSGNSAALSRDLQVLRRAIEAYNAEHGAYPAAADVAAQLTRYSDTAGATSVTKTGGYVYGPYLREIPATPTGPAKGSRTIAASAGAGVGWVYDEATGTINANAPGG